MNEDEGKDAFVTRVRFLLKAGCYKEVRMIKQLVLMSSAFTLIHPQASHCINKLRLQDSFHIGDLIGTLLLLNNINLIQSHVYQNRKQQEALLLFLDNLLDEDTDLELVLQYVEHYSMVLHVMCVLQHGVTVHFTSGVTARSFPARAR